MHDMFPSCNFVLYHITSKAKNCWEKTNTAIQSKYWWGIISKEKFVVKKTFVVLFVNVNERIINILIVKLFGSVHNCFLLIFYFTIASVNFARLIEN